MSLRTRHALLVFLALAGTYGQFFQAATWGSAVRFDLARALAEHRTVVIDDYHRNTGDKALKDGTYYSDKAPLPSLLGAPGVAMAHVLRSVTGRPASQAVWLAMAAGLATFLASGWVTALGGSAFFLALRDRGASPGAAALFTGFVFLGTTLFPYATILAGHAPTAAWAIVFYHLAFPARGTLCPRRCLLAGAAASAAVATEYVVGPPLALLGVVAVVRAGRGAPRAFAAMVAGALPGVLLLGLYHQAAFGSPIALGYQYVALPFFQQKMAGGLFGIGAPDPVVALRLLFGPWRGQLVASPVVIAALGGVVLLARIPGRRMDAAAAAVFFLYYWLLNSGYSTWHGGWAIGPRHLVPALPFLGLGLPAAYARFPRIVGGLGAVSMLFALTATSVQPEVPEEIGNPLFTHLLPHFVRGELSVGEQGFGDLYPARLDPAVPDRWDAFLLGEALRLPGVLALLPLLILPAIVFRRVTRAESAP
jgi:hypothetical protein